MIAYDLSFAGDKPEEKGDDDNYERIHGQLKAWNILTSWKMQKEAFRRAMLIKANIISSDNPENFQIYDNDRSICIFNKSSGVVKKYNYNISRFKVFIKNFLRKFSYLNFCGGGTIEPNNKVIFSLIWYLNFRYKYLRGLKDFYNRLST